MFHGQGGEPGQGYSLTPYGEEWLRDGRDDAVPLEPGRMATMLGEVATRFGPGFLERSQQAVAAYNGRAYLACCAMCGAAAESIMLALAIARSDDAQKTLNTYTTAGGRGQIKAQILKGQPKHAQDELHRYVALLEYWRDSSAHGRAVRIDEPEAWTSLVLLLRFGRWAEDRWEGLTANTPARPPAPTA